MSFVIGLRFYKLFNRYKKSKNKNSGAPISNDVFAGFVNNFVDSRKNITERSDLQRAWYAEPAMSTDREFCFGWIKWGTYGFGSALIDPETREEKYRRIVSDVEEIPLFYHFYFPENCNFSIVSLQSFAGRSCVIPFLSALKEEFENKYSNIILQFPKISPEDVSGGPMSSAPVKKFTLIRNKAYTDVADQYADSASTDVVDVELSFKAQRKGFLGPLSKYKNIKPSKDNVLIFREMEFDRAKAEIDFGGKRRTVTVFGADYDAGQIDITEDVDRDGDGHPKLESIRNEVEQMSKTFYKTLSKNNED